MIEDMRALCEKEGLDEVALHIDDGLSGGYRDRDEFEAWLNDARTGACEVLVPYNTDRLTREGLNVAASILDTIEGKDPATGRPAHLPVRLVDCFGLDSLHGDAFRFRFVIQAEVGRSERERIRQRNKDRARRLRNAGRWAGGPIPFGYRPVDNPEGAGKILEIVPEEAQAIRKAAEEILAGDTLGKVARRMNHAGVKPRRAAMWSRVTLSRVLTGDHIVGRITVNGRLARDAEGNILAPFAPILTVGQLTALRATLGKGKPPVRTGRAPAHLLSGLLTCHSCDRTLSASSRKTGRFYRCYTRGSGGICERPVVVSASAIEPYVEKRYLAAVGHMPMYKERTVVSGLEELAAVEEEIKATLADMATSATADTFKRLQDLQARQAELSARDTDKRTELIPTGQTMAEHWKEAMVEDRRTLLAEAIDELIVYPGRQGQRIFTDDRLVLIWAENEDEDLDEDQEAALDATLAPVVAEPAQEIPEDLAPFLEAARRLQADGVDVASLLAPE
ncbi:recombinase family protein [Streptomyces cylindrosporus]|uniref:Recombinase family protein n=1 Tax=Streptomyces cylindrosporus TaxID=2927583 RepID=A0ABS9Y1B9_9ACTN|nr:recombinase family protein [Streptomyces cylindrosporus]MCI3271007.1 recombinase family protein [Streptomyces cylindrosporus]